MGRLSHVMLREVSTETFSLYSRKGKFAGFLPSYKEGAALVKMAKVVSGVKKKKRRHGVKASARALTPGF